jgi:hypothetical protein
MKPPCEVWPDGREQAWEVFAANYLAQIERQAVTDDDHRDAEEAFEKWWTTGIVGGVEVPAEPPQPWCGTPLIMRHHERRLREEGL